jgi:hypothetical protein
VGHTVLEKTWVEGEENFPFSFLLSSLPPSLHAWSEKHTYSNHIFQKEELEGKERRQLRKKEEEQQNEKSQECTCLSFFF